MKKVTIIFIIFVSIFLFGYFGDADPPFGDIDPPLGVYDIMSCISKNEKTIAKLLFFS